MNWRKINGINYEVSENGDIRNFKTKREIKQRVYGNTDYMTVFLRLNGKPKIYSVHRLVATCFLENKLNKKEVNHIDGNKKNNCYKNLDWVTRSENMKHMYDTGLKKYKPLHYKGKFGKDHNRSKTVKCIETGITYGSMSEAGRELNMDASSVSWAIRKNKPIYGMHFELAN